MPLPNLNKLFGGGTGSVGRMENSLSPTPATAQRKSAIVNDPMKTTSRVSMGNIQSDMEHLNKPRPERNRLEFLQPPGIPQYESGFVPMLPGSGGFKPIPNPITLGPLNITEIIQHRTEKPNVGTSEPTPPKNFNKKTIAEENSPLYQTKLEHLATSYSTHSNSNTNDNGGAKNTTKSFTLEKTTLKNEIKVLSGMITSNYSKDSIETIPEQTSKEAFEQIELLTTEKEEPPMTTSAPIITTEEYIQTTTHKITATTKLVNPPPSIVETPFIDQKKGESSVEKLTATPLSTFLAPNGYQPQLKPSVKSTITKVASPHPKPDPQPQINGDFPFVLDPLPHREAKTSRNFMSNHPNSSLTDDNEDKGWYFANYNRTDLKPFVAKIMNSSQRRYHRSHMLIFISYITLILLI